MTDRPERDEQQRRAAEVKRQASQAQGTILGEFVQFFLHNKKWWLIPIVLVLLALGVLLVLDATGLTLLIYPF